MRTIFIALLFPVFLMYLSLPSKAQTQQDTLYAYLAKTPAVIDGSAADACWDKAQWQPIENVWIPYNATMDAGDFEGHFKLAWDSLYLYLLVEIIDDSLSDDHSNPLQNWWDDDCLEIFIDENRSKGNHERNNNAFAYHVSIFYDAVDLNSSGSGVNYKDNLEVVMDTVTDDKYLWEAAIKNYTSAFTPSDPEASRVYLHHHKLMGFTLAYCDNDETTGRENFIGSMYMSQATANNNYITADYFGSLLLVDPDYVEPTALKNTHPDELLKVFPNPAGDWLSMKGAAGQLSGGKLELRDICGKLIMEETFNSGNHTIYTGGLDQGLYLLQWMVDGKVYSGKFLKSK
jgi:hypothetical protein